MAIETPLSLEFIKDHFPSTYTLTPPLSFRTINSTLGRTTPDSFLDFNGNRLDRFTYVSGADGAAITGQGDLFSTLAQTDYAQFQDTCNAGDDAYVRVDWINTTHYSNLVSKYQVRVYLGYFGLSSGTYTSGNIFLQNYNSSSGSWVVKAVIGSPTPSVTYLSITTALGWSQLSNLWRIQIENNSSSGSCTLNLGVGVRIIKI